MLLKEDRAADVMNHRNYNMTQSKLKLESSELVSLEFSVFGAGSCWPTLRNGILRSKTIPETLGEQAQ